MYHMSKNDSQAINNFIQDFEVILTDVTNESKFLKLTESNEEIKQEALKILRKKLKKIHKSESIDDLKKVLKVKKLLGK
ncbi:hypothetical protein D1872_36690 [compost metagenome]